jgi:ribosomal protein S18 acetylase RimI-like enzyme
MSTQLFLAEIQIFSFNYEPQGFAFCSVELLPIDQNQALPLLYLDDGRKALRIIDISLIPSARGQGIGRAIVTDLVEAAAAARKKVSPQVEKRNLARRLYDRLGFGPRTDHGIYVEMEWRTGSTA